jgi:hypothetical protein
MLQYVLGELDDAGALEVKAQIDRGGSAAELHASVSSMVAALNRSRDIAAGFRVEPEAVARLVGQALSARRTLGSTLAAGAERLVALLSFDSWRAVPKAALARGGDGSRRVVFESDAASIDVRIDPSSTVLAAYDCIGKVEGAPNASVVWRELDSGREHRIHADSDGFFECVIAGGTHQIELSIAGRTVLTPAVTHPVRDGAR